jgi:EAL domain-containing protein (putative c-di-GMP-specific phosphodiesterase class I)
VVMPAERRIFAYEALLRTEERRIPHPGAFLEAAERLGRVRDLERSIRVRIAEFAHTLPDGASLLVNLHPTSLDDPQLSSDQDPLAPFAQRIILEITERTALHDLMAARDQVAVLRRSGYRIAVDDLGAGYAGLTSVAALSPDLVKLDMSLVRDIDKSPSRAKIVSGLTAIARDMDIGVVAEGVETDAELAELCAIGCDIFQGYRFAKPGKPFPSVVW